MLRKNGDGRTNLAGSAIPALQRITAYKSGLHWMKMITIRQAFDGGNFITGMHHREREAAIDALPVDDDCTGAALPLIASLL
jgi:hypothetical protein